MTKEAASRLDPIGAAGGFRKRRLMLNNAEAAILAALASP
jgi:hypothetical protein